MSSFAFSSRAACVALVCALSLTASIGAQARERVKALPHQAHEFYAVAPTPVEEEAPAAKSQCFTTNSPMEATKGIRHWSGRC